jgi:hypothetical protein
MHLEPGELAWVQSGPFAGFQGQIVELNRNSTALVSLDIFGRSTPTELDPAVLGSWTPDSGVAGVREPRRPLPPTDTASISAPLPSD